MVKHKQKRPRKLLAHLKLNKIDLESCLDM